MIPKQVHAATLALAFSASAFADGSRLESDFRNPPVNTRPYVWWHWLGPNFSKEGITRDLEAMKASGIGGATIFNITSSVMESHAPTFNNPWPDQTYRSPKYWEALRHAAAEAQRLGLEIGLHNTVGYSTTGGPWIDEPRSMQRIVTTSATVDGGGSVSIDLPAPKLRADEGWGATGRRISWFKDFAVLAVPADNKPVPAGEVLDLTKHMSPSGRLVWNAPAGKWTVYRMTHASTGRPPHPVPDDMLGKVLEADKMSLEQSRFHWDQVIGPVKQHLGPYLGKSFKHFLIDSYEAGQQNWTPSFREEFRKRKGYDPLPWLLVLEKRVIGSADLTARFQWDHDDVIRSLFHENGWLTGVRKIKDVGMDLQFEPYGGQFDTVDGTAIADIPMGEFWTSGGGGINGTVVAAARAAGRTVVGAEAFTGPPNLSKWSETPAYLKRSADGTFASGANRMILHHWVHQPFDDRYKPGFGMGWWGTHFNRHQTWARDGAAFFQYLGRCQALLQSGESPSDVVSVGKSQGGDIISWREFRAGLIVRDGRVVVKSGRSYPLLGIPHDGRMFPDDIARIENLLAQGAVVVCAKPGGAPGLSGYPDSDTRVKSSTLWNGGDVSKVGKGVLYTKGDMSAAMRERKITPLFHFNGAPGIAGAARRTNDTTLFFVANPGTGTASFTGSFRITGQRPELWNAEDGSIRFAPVWRIKDGRTEVDLTLGGNKSVFVVFRESNPPSDHVVSVTTVSGNALEITGARFGTPDGNRWMDVTARLKELSGTGGLRVAAVTPGVFRRDPAPNTVKQLELEYRLAGESHKLTVKEGDKLQLGESPDTHGPVDIAANEDGSISISSPAATVADVVFASGRKQELAVAAAAVPVSIVGPWDVELDSPVAEKRSIKIPTLVNLAENPDPEIKYFSGIATYRGTFEAPSGGRAVLDLGKVHDLARIKLNGRDLGVIWHGPFSIDVSSALKQGANQLEIAVTNTWHNRLVGDEQHPADFEWGGDRGEKGHAMKSYPDWFVKNQPRPEKGRKCFVVWYYHRKDTKLLPAGLVGPVRLIPSQTAVTRTSP